MRTNDAILKSNRQTEEDDDIAAAELEREEKDVEDEAGREQR